VSSDDSCRLVTQTDTSRSLPRPFGREPPVTDFPAFVAHVAEANRERDGSPVEYVARHVVVAPTVVDDTQTRLWNGTPYVRERVRPRAILSAAAADADAADADAGAVDTLADALRDYYDTHGWAGVETET
jgi:ribosomal protein S19